MNITFYTDLATFRQRASPLLKSHCAVNSLKLGILEHYCNHQERSDNQVFAIGVDHGEVIAVFIQTRSLYFFASEAHFDEIISCAIEEFLSRQIIVSSVMGYGETAARFAEGWKKRTQAGVESAGRDYLYEITAIGNRRPAKGALKRAGSADMAELKPLFREYYREDLGVTKTDRDLEQCIAQHLAQDEVYFWDDGGVKSMVTAMLPFDTGVELANVFTPQEYRRLGYARTCLEEVCRTLLQRYPRVVLFVDQDNTAANSLYTRIGFRLVDEMNSYQFVKATS